MAPCISIGNQGFESIREENSFYIDKSDFIREWWESADVMTLITRPRRFGKTLNMSMVNCFFSNQYAGRSDLFEGLSVWKEEKYRKLQGTYPVIFLSFADVKQTNYEDAVRKIKNIIEETYMQHAYLNEAENISETEKRQLRSVSETMGDVTAQDSLKNLAGILYRYYGKKAIILLDEYDTPMQEAYIHGYWDEFTAFIRSLFNSSFKTASGEQKQEECEQIMSSFAHAVISKIDRDDMEQLIDCLNELYEASREEIEDRKMRQKGE